MARPIPADGKVAGTFDLGGGPEFAVADGSGYVYDNAVEVNRGSLKVTMHRLELTSGTAVWTEPDAVAISAPLAKAIAQGK